MDESTWKAYGTERSWYASLTSCFDACVDEGEKTVPKPSFSVLRQQPGSESRPAYQYGQGVLHSKTWAGESLSPRRHGFGLQQRSRTFEDGKMRRERVRRSQIGRPTDFRHVAHESFDFPGDDVLAPARDEPSPIKRPCRASYRPLVLSIFIPDQGLSPLLPQFGIPRSPARPPSQRRSLIQSPIPLSGEEQQVIATLPPARLADARDDAYVLSHQRIQSSMSFHLPRRQNSTTSEPGKSSASSSTESGRGGRARPTTTTLVQRIASAMIDLEKLQERIDCVVERQSVYLGTHRTSNVYSFFTQSLDCLPSMPPISPPDAPSFAERMKGRRQTLSSSQLCGQTAPAVLESRRRRTVVVSPTHLAPIPQTPVEMPVEADSEELRPRPAVFTKSRLSAPGHGHGHGHSHLRPQSFVSDKSHASSISSCRASVPNSLLCPVVQNCPESSVCRSSEISGRAESVCSIQDGRPDSVLADMDDTAHHDRDTILLSPHERTAIVAVSQKPRAVMTGGRPSTMMPKQSSARTMITSRRPLTLTASPARMALQAEENPDNTSSPSGSGPMSWIEKKGNGLDASALAGKNPIMLNPGPSLRRKRSLSQLNWHVLPTTTGPALPENNNGREGFYSCMEFTTKTSLCWSIDSVSTASAPATPTETEMPGRNSSAVETMPVVTVESTEDVEMADVDCVNAGEDFIIDRLGSNHLSFDFGPLGRDSVAMSFKHIRGSFCVNECNVSDKDLDTAWASDAESGSEPNGGDSGDLEKHLAVLNGVAFGMEGMRRSVGVAF